MRGYRNKIIILATLAATTWLGYLGIRYGSSLTELATIIGAQWAGAVGAVFGRGYNKGKEALNGGVQ